MTELIRYEDSDGNVSYATIDGSDWAGHADIRGWFHMAGETITVDVPGKWQLVGCEFDFLVDTDLKLIEE